MLQPCAHVFFFDLKVRSPQNAPANACTCPVNHCDSAVLSAQAFERFLTPFEMLSSHCIPTTDHHADLAGTPRLDLDKVRPSQVIKMSGNAMSLPCVGCMLLAILFGLELKTHCP